MFNIVPNYRSTVKFSYSVFQDSEFLILLKSRASHQVTLTNKKTSKNSGQIKEGPLVIPVSDTWDFRQNLYDFRMQVHIQKKFLGRTEQKNSNFNHQDFRVHKSRISASFISTACRQIFLPGRSLWRCLLSNTHFTHIEHVILNFFYKQLIFLVRPLVA